MRGLRVFENNADQLTGCLAGLFTRLSKTVATLGAFYLARLQDVPEFFGGRLPALRNEFEDRDPLAENPTWDGVVSLEVLISLLDVVISCFDDAIVFDCNPVAQNITSSAAIQECIAKCRQTRNQLVAIRPFTIPDQTPKAPINELMSVPVGLVLSIRSAIAANVVRLQGLPTFLKKFVDIAQDPKEKEVVEASFMNFVRSLFGPEGVAGEFVAKMKRSGELNEFDQKMLEEALVLIANANIFPSAE